MGLILPIAAMSLIVAVSNYWVQFPINDWLTWGALTFPVAFLITDLTNRAYGPAHTRRVVYVGFAIAVALSYMLVDARIALASGTAFLVSQLCDVFVFDRLRNRPWWQAPLGSSAIASTLDTALFFSLAFAGTAVPWQTLALGDLVVKFAVAACMLIPFRVLLAWIRPVTAAAD
ncbi:MAG: queuosine precursor transporter [Alphaproteobacteria bacterium]|nr:queuosine precursor transporter [Alphaproteobacteria bacterium]